MTGVRRFLDKLQRQPGRETQSDKPSGRRQGLVILSVGLCPRHQIHYAASNRAALR